MKTPLLCCLLFCLAPITQAQQLQASATSSKSTDDHTAVQTSAASEYFGLQSLNARLDRTTPLFAERYCAYLRTYRVRRESRNSDVVSPAGYTECVPASRFEVKRAVVIQPESGGDR